MCNHSSKSKDFSKQVWVCVTCKMESPLRDEKMKLSKMLRHNLQNWCNTVPNDTKYFDITKEKSLKFKAFVARYMKYKEYCKETLPQWEKVDTLYFADNSVEEVQKSKVTGKVRHITITSPHGDLCF